MTQNARWVRYATVVASLLAGAAVWELSAYFTTRAFWAPLSETLASLGESARSGVLMSQALSSFKLYLVGLAAAILAGAPLGLILARARWLRVALENYIMMLYATPMVALIPFILSMMGFGFAPKALVVFLFAVFPILYNTIEGARSVRPELIEVARAIAWRIPVMVYGSV